MEIMLDEPAIESNIPPFCFAYNLERIFELGCLFVVPCAIAFA